MGVNSNIVELPIRLKISNSDKYPTSTSPNPLKCQSISKNGCCIPK